MAVVPSWPSEEAEGFMGQALSEALRARDLGEVPIGAVVVDPDGRVSGRGYNRTIIDHDPGAHAEMIAIREAASRAGNHRLPGFTVFSTIEPCLMCCGLLVQARIHALYYGAADPRVGCVESVYRGLEDGGGLNHRFEVHGGLLEARCREIIQTFFRLRRG